MAKTQINITLDKTNRGLAVTYQSDTKKGKRLLTDRDVVLVKLEALRILTGFISEELVKL